MKKFVKSKSIEESPTAERVVRAGVQVRFRLWQNEYKISISILCVFRLLVLHRTPAPFHHLHPRQKEKVKSPAE